MGNFRLLCVVLEKEKRKKKKKKKKKKKIKVEVGSKFSGGIIVVLV
jgi:hypothetical protein